MDNVAVAGTLQVFCNQRQQEGSVSLGGKVCGSVCGLATVFGASLIVWHSRQCVIERWCENHQDKFIKFQDYAAENMVTFKLPDQEYP